MRFLGGIYFPLAGLKSGAINSLLFLSLAANATNPASNKSQDCRQIANQAAVQSVIMAGASAASINAAALMCGFGAQTGNFGCSSLVDYAKSGLASMTMTTEHQGAERSCAENGVTEGTLVDAGDIAKYIPASLIGLVSPDDVQEQVALLCPAGKCAPDNFDPFLDVVKNSINSGLLNLNADEKDKTLKELASAREAALKGQMPAGSADKAALALKKISESSDLVDENLGVGSSGEARASLAERLVGPKNTRARSRAIVVDALNMNESESGTPLTLWERATRRYLGDDMHSRALWLAEQETQRRRVIYNAQMAMRSYEEKKNPQKSNSRTVSFQPSRNNSGDMRNASEGVFK